jgi:hypothetical protein
MGCLSRPTVTEDELIRIAQFVCSYSPGNILLIGGGCVLSETAGYRRMRGLSDDLDFIANEEGLEAVKMPLNVGTNYKNGKPSDCRNVTYINDVLIGFFEKEIRGWKIPEEVFQRPRTVQTAAGETIYMIPAELNIALKIRRGASRTDKPRIYGKDALDAASIFLGMEKNSESFDQKAFISYLLQGVCADCRLSEHKGCLMALRDSESQLFGSDRIRYGKFMTNCASSLGTACVK